MSSRGVMGSSGRGVVGLSDRQVGGRFWGRQLTALGVTNPMNRLRKKHIKKTLLEVLISLFKVIIS